MLPDWLRLATGALTTWRVPPPREITPAVAGAAMAAAPLVMLPLAVLLGLGAWLGCWLGAPPPVLAALLVTGHVLSTRGMHLDGLADTADGLSASYDRQRALAVMKTSDVGPSGAGAITLALALQITSVAALAGHGRHLLLAVLALLTSRATLAWGCRQSYPAATPGGLGATVGRSVSPVRLATALTLLVLLSAGCALGAGLPAFSGPLVVAAGLGANLALLARTRRRLGGMTGDVLGAGIEIGLSAALAAAAITAAALG